MALQLARARPVFADLEGGHRNPEHFSRQFADDAAALRQAARRRRAARGPAS